VTGEGTGVSVVIPLYNKADQLARCLMSVGRQTPRPLEIIVVNDGSTDDGASIADALLSDRDLLVDQPNQGVSAARNRGIAAASGDIVAFLDADDEWLPDHLAHIIELSQRFPEAGLYGTGHERRGPDVSVTITYDSLHPALVNLFRATERYGLLTASSVAARVEALRSCGGFRAASALGEDMEWWNRLGLRYPLAFHPDVSAVYHVGVPGAAAASASQACTSTHVILHSLYHELTAERVTEEMRRDVQDYAAYRLIDYAWWCIARGRRRLALTTLGHPYLAQSVLAPEALALHCALTVLPTGLLHRYHRFRNSRWCMWAGSEHNGARVALGQQGSGGGASRFGQEGERAS